MLVSPPPPAASPSLPRALFLALLVLTAGVSACLAQEELAKQAAPRLPGDHNTVIPNVPF
ncbi:hypothetical protein [Pyxidicoccus sp. MSG2]|uniref:hypothetical protein n=1 Tax=Pyxidicoccus sp. MSG2 TaxID=2996790 RepID=UPI00226DDF72|nr:hypothetical protein [Pyxidicoccus sp. MSG2]MCY1014556.1 hypothetical protein [Pyxidicoccus sp. MSG2]